MGLASNLLIAAHLTLSCLERSETNVVWITDTFENKFEIKHKFIEYLKGICALGSYQHFSFKYFQKKAFIKKILLKLSGCLWVLMCHSDRCWLLEDHGESLSLDSCKQELIDDTANFYALHFHI